MIEVKNLHKHFGKLEVLNGINEHISPGEKVVVIGPSGSGKSTFLRLRFRPRAKFTSTVSASPKRART